MRGSGYTYFEFEIHEIHYFKKNVNIKNKMELVSKTKHPIAMK